MFDFLTKFRLPLWVMVGIVFCIIIFLLSKTIIKNCKKVERNQKIKKVKTQYQRDIKPYDDVKVVRKNFNNK